MVLLQNRKATIGLAVLGLFVLIATIGPFLVRDAAEFLSDPLAPPSAEFWFGTTRQGQDVFAQTIVGARTSLIIGFTVGIVVVAIGATVGIAAGVFGGWVDDALSLLTNVFLIMPGLPLAIANMTGHHVLATRSFGLIVAVNAVIGAGLVPRLGATGGAIASAAALLIGTGYCTIRLYQRTGINSSIFTLRSARLARRVVTIDGIFRARRS